MKNEDVTFGMKVVPHSKSIWCSLKESIQWENAFKNKQNFLYVANYDNDEESWILCTNYPELVDNEFYDGDFFLSEDFELYQEEKIEYKVILSGFETKNQARKFLDWYEGQGEQDDSIGEIMGDDISHVLTDVKSGMIEHSDGWEYKVNVCHNSDDE